VVVFGVRVWVVFGFGFFYGCVVRCGCFFCVGFWVFDLGDVFWFCVSYLLVGLIVIVVVFCFSCGVVCYVSSLVWWWFGGLGLVWGFGLVVCFDMFWWFLVVLVGLVLVVFCLSFVVFGCFDFSEGSLLFCLR